MKIYVVWKIDNVIHWNLISIGLDTGLELNRPHALFYTNDYPVNQYAFELVG